MLKLLLAVLTTVTFCHAQFPPEPEGLTVVQSKYNSNVTISYKESDICETTPGVRSFAGYVNLPPGTLASLGITNQTWPINTFFWFFEAKNDSRNAPLVISVGGGPAAHSSGIPISLNGPCRVNPDANSTHLFEWSWNHDVNLVYFDQPVQVGLSYDTLQNITYDLLSGTYTLLDKDAPVPEQNTTFEVGTWASVDIDKTSPGSVNGAYAFWHILQVWLQEFPEYEPINKRITMTGSGYSGKYTTAMFAFFEEQNERIRNGTWQEPGRTYILELDTLIFENGIMDLVDSWWTYPEIAVNNTYGIKGVNDTIYEQMYYELNRPGGCLDQAYLCGNLTLQYDPLAIGVNETVNALCRDAAKYCDEMVQYPFQLSGRSFSDITVPDTFEREPPFYQAYLQRPHVQQALGMRLNWTYLSDWVFVNNRREGDFARPGWLQKMAYLLEKGVKIAFIYGDRDYICNWFMGEANSLAINYANTPEFHAAGYEPIVTNDSYIGGQVRQYGNLSFSRVYQAGRAPGILQPETVYRIMKRAVFNQDIATGTKPAINSDGTGYSSKGPSDISGITNEVQSIDDILQVCYLLDVNFLSYCTTDQIAAVANGTAVIKDYIIVDKNSTLRYPEIVGPPGTSLDEREVEGEWPERGVGRRSTDQMYYI